MQRNLETFQAYLREQRVNGIKEATLSNDMAVMPRLAEYLGDKTFKEASKDEIMAFVESLMIDLKPSTIHTYKVRLKHFYNRIFNLPRGQYPASVLWIRTTNPYKGTKTKGVAISFDPDDLLTPTDILALVNACDHPRDQAVISVMYETSCEAQELLSMKIKHYSTDEYGARLTIESGQGKRTVRLVDSIPYVTNWLLLHPLRDNPEAALWVTRMHGLRPIGYDNLYRLLQHAKKEADIKKPVTPRYLRHAGLTRMAKLLNEQNLKKYAGWTPDSKMAAVYVHLTSEDLDKALLQAHGVSAKETPMASAFLLKPQECPRCGKPLAKDWMRCPYCGMNLLRGRAHNIEKLWDHLLQDPDEIMRLLHKYDLDKQEPARDEAETRKKDKP